MAIDRSLLYKPRAFSNVKVPDRQEVFKDETWHLLHGDLYNVLVPRIATVSAVEREILGIRYDELDGEQMLTSPQNTQEVAWNLTRIAAAVHDGLPVRLLNPATLPTMYKNVETIIKVYTGVIKPVSNVCYIPTQDEIALLEELASEMFEENAVEIFKDIHQATVNQNPFHSTEDGLLGVAPKELSVQQKDIKREPLYKAGTVKRGEI